MFEKPNLTPTPEKINNEEEKQKGMSRRDFLKKTTKAVAFMSLIGSEALLTSGCAKQKMGLKNQEISNGLENFNRNLEDPNGYLEYLEDREFVIKDEIFDSYAKTVDKRPDWITSPSGGYMAENYLDTKEEEKEFEDKLIKLKLSQKEIEFYKSLLTSTDLIIFSESILKDKDFLKALPHERFHKNIKKISKEKYEMMQGAAQEIMNNLDGKDMHGYYVAAASMNWEEFYTYLAQGEFEDSMEQKLKNDYPEAYEIFNQTKKKCELKK